MRQRIVSRNCKLFEPKKWVNGPAATGGLRDKVIETRPEVRRAGLRRGGATPPSPFSTHGRREDARPRAPEPTGGLCCADRVRASCGSVRGFRRCGAILLARWNA